MKFVKLGANYLFKNIWYIALIWILPSIFSGLCCGPFQVIEFMNNYGSTTISSFSDIFTILMPFTLQRILLSILSLILLSIFLSLSVGIMESHMRSGKLRFKEMFSYVNNDILVVLINLVVLAVIYLVLVFLLGSVLFLLHLLLSGLSNIPTILNVIFAIILCSGVMILFTLLSSLFLINIPNMISNGYSFKEGISSTAQLFSKSTFKLLCSYLIPYILIIPFVSLLAKTGTIWLANIICAFVINIYFSTITMTSYFELSDTPRYDNRKYYNYNK